MTGQDLASLDEITDLAIGVLTRSLVKVEVREATDRALGQLRDVGASLDHLSRTQKIAYAQALAAMERLRTSLLATQPRVEP